MYSPILLSDSVSVLPNQKRSPRTDSFQNPFRTPMLIDEIRMSAANSSGSNFDPFAIRFKLTFGRNDLMSDYIPMPMLGKMLNPTPLTSPQPAAGPSNVYTWKFKKPLYVPPTELVEASIFNSPGLTNAAASNPNVVQLTYAGRSLAKSARPPAEIPIPYAALWMGVERVIGDDGSNFTDDSTEADLVNPFDVPLQVQRFLGRIRCLDSSGGSFRGFDALENVDRARIAQEMTLVQMSDSLGRQAVRDPTPFNNVFSAIDRAWTVNTLLPPKGFFVAHLEENWLTAEDIGSTERAQPIITMIGQRMLKLDRGELR